MTLIICIALTALVIYVGYQHMDTHDKNGKVIEAAPLMTSKTIYLAASEGVGVAAGAISASAVKTVSLDKDRRAAGAASLAASTKFQGFGTTSAYNRTYKTTADKIDDFIYNKPAAKATSSTYGIHI